jgi:triacylglycerol esterase/lipase EstA (alpha/beta hydrolase family)
LLSAVNRHDDAPPAAAAQLLRAWWGEVRLAPLVFCWRQPFRSNAQPDWLPERSARGIVLVHGFLCNRGFWNPWMPRLRAAGVPHVAVNLEPVFASIDAYASCIDAAVRRLALATGRPPLVVAHSMGGLAVRAWLSRGDAADAVHGVVTIGTPHRGTWLGRFAFARNGAQMRLDSPWLQELAARERKLAAPARYTCFYSHCDNVVFPASAATLAGADNRHIEGSAHVNLASEPAVFDEVMRRVTEPDAPVTPAVQAPGQRFAITPRRI